MFSMALQSTSDSTGTLQCLVIIVIWVAVGIWLASISSKSKQASIYSETARTTLARDEVEKLAYQVTSKKPIFNGWKRKKVEPDRFVIYGYPLGMGQGCLGLLLTGILPGFIIMAVVMKQSERVTLDFSNFDDTGEVMVRAEGIMTKEPAVQLVRRLEAEQAAPE